MKILAIHYGHNCTVGLSIDGRVVALVSEERLCRIKNATGFPFQAMNEIVSQYLDGDLGAVDTFAIIDSTGRGAAYLLRHGLQPQRYLDYYWNRKPQLWRQVCMPTAARLKGRLRPLIHQLRRLWSPRDARRDVMHQVGLPSEKVLFLDHHSCHAAAAACFGELSDGGPWLVLTLDAEGDALSSSVSIFRGGGFERISSSPANASLGYLYAETTAYLGMRPNEHEFKLMGMAPYADPDQVDRLAVELGKLIWLGSDGAIGTAIPSMDMLPELAKLYAFERFDVICGAIQKVTENLICRWAGYWLRQTGLTRVAVSGGVFMNVKAAKSLSELPAIEKLFVVPSSSDESLPLGAFWLANAREGSVCQPITDLYLGRGFSTDYIERMIQHGGLEASFEIERYQNADEAAGRVAALLAGDQIVARCCGREEWGARALGNRSILCNPSSFQNIERLNSKIKCRDFWMPFTPSLLAEEFPRYVVNPKNIFAPYMAITFDTTELAKRHFAAAVHPRDFTMRPQAVLAAWNPGYYNLIRQFRDLTGIGGVLNTSFNLHGEPNVSTPEDAIRTVRNSGLEFVLIENFLFRKIDSESHRGGE